MTSPLLSVGAVIIHEPAVLIEGVLFRARYLGSTQLVCEGQPTKATRMLQAEEAVSRIKVSTTTSPGYCYWVLGTTTGCWVPLLAAGF